jgi:hypothetical protein
VAVAVLIAGCGAGGSSPPSTADTTAAVSSSGYFDPTLANQRSQSAAANAGGLVQQAPASTPATTPPPQKTQSKPTHTAAPPPVTHTVTKTTSTKPITKVKTVVRFKTRTVTKTVTKTVPPNIPSGAFLPSMHPVLAQKSFTVAGDNIGCTFTGAGVRCVIQQRVWAPPAQPSSCTSVWGNTIGLGGKGTAEFACGGSSSASANAKVVPDGWDDKVGQITCQVRIFGVDCFAPSRHGFMISRTGYVLY